MNRPLYNVTFKKKGGKRQRVGAIWASRFEDGPMTLAPARENTKYDSAFADALKAYLKGEGYFDIYPVDPPDDARDTSADAPPDDF